MGYIQRFLRGRYGTDQLNVALIAVYFVATLVAALTHVVVLQYACLSFALYAIFRMFSRNMDARRRENAWFLRWARPIYTGRAFKRFRSELRDREHLYFDCPACRARLRVPKKRGTLRVTCPQCRTVINAKT